MSKVFIGIDCTGETYSCGLLSEEGVFTSITGLSPRRALLEIPGHIQYLLRNAEVAYSDVAAVGVTGGPGSFTGVRLGITFAKTIAFACQCKILALDTLQVLAGGQADAHAGGFVGVALDARRGELYCGIFRLEQGTHPVLVTAVRTPRLFARELLQFDDLRCLVGAGFAAYPELLPENFKGPVLSSPAHTTCSTEFLCRQARTAWEENRLLEASEVEPIYHRRADIQVSGVIS